jgi:hypothetical protein
MPRRLESIKSAIPAGVVLMMSVAGCGGRSAGPHALKATSKDYTVRGEYALVALDRVESLKVENGRLVLHGPPADLVLDMPSSADSGRPARHWALVTDSHLDDRHQFTFSESESVTDITIELPDGEAPLHFDVFAGRAGGEVMVFASGDRANGPPSLWGFLSIERRSRN